MSELRVGPGISPAARYPRYCLTFNFAPFFNTCIQKWSCVLNLCLIKCYFLDSFTLTMPSVRFFYHPRRCVTAGSIPTEVNGCYMSRKKRHLSLSVTRKSDCKGMGVSGQRPGQVPRILPIYAFSVRVEPLEIWRKAHLRLFPRPQGTVDLNQDRICSDRR